MVEKELGMWAVAVTAVGSILTMVTAFLKANSGSRKIESFERKMAMFQEKISKTVDTQNSKLSENEDGIGKVRLEIISKIDSHDKKVKEEFMSRAEVDAAFQRNSSELSRQAVLATDRFNQLIRYQEKQEKKIDTLFEAVTDIRSAHIDSLEMSNREKDSKIGLLEAELRRLKDK